MQDSMPRLKDYLDAIFKNKKWIILITLVSVSAAFIAARAMPKLYNASAIAYVVAPIMTTNLQPESMAILNPAPAAQPLLSRFGTDIQAANFSIKAWEEIAKGQDVLKGIIDRLKTEDITLEELESALRVERSEEFKAYTYIYYAPIIKLSIRTRRGPDLAADIVNAWGDIFVEKLNAFYLSQLQEAHEFMLKQYRQSEAALKAAEAALLEFKNSPDAQKGSLKAQLTEIALDREAKDAMEAYGLFRQKKEQSGVAIEERAIKAVLVSRAVPPSEGSTGQNMFLIIALAGTVGFLISVFFAIALAAVPENPK